MASKHGLILLVDDDADFIEIHRRLLERAGYTVVSARDTESALRTLEQCRPDLIISDLMMSRLDEGFSLARRVKEDARYSSIPVFIVTAASSRQGFDFAPTSPADLAAMHADAYFSKPVSSPALLSRIEELLKHE